MSKPILFNTEMVRAILEGRKTQTRRLCRGQPQDGMTSPEKVGYKPPYDPGDVLYVRETWCSLPVSPGGHMRIQGVYYYRADPESRQEGWRGNWKPSIHMPKKAARLFLRVTGVRCERLRDIDWRDALAEGVKVGPNTANAASIWAFMKLWNSTVKPDELSCCGWDANPWVWVIEFEKMERKPDE